MFNFIKKLFFPTAGITETNPDAVSGHSGYSGVLPPPRVRAARGPSKTKDPVTAAPKTPKEEATEKGEPYVGILSVAIDPTNVNNGSFELDWNDKFLVNLIKSGYQIKSTDTDAQIVDRWFQTVCRNIALEVYEQQQADPDNRDDTMRVVRSKSLGDGRTEVS